VRGSRGALEPESGDKRQRRSSLKEAVCWEEEKAWRARKAKEIPVLKEGVQVSLEI